MRLLLLRLEGPLQSWGERSKWDNRDTALMPTKSGLVGIIGCCMGIGRGEPRLTELGEQLRLAIRADRMGRVMTDFHTVQKDGKLMTADNKGKKGTIVSRRQYLQDASFLVAVAGEDAVLDACASALRRPVWTPFLGRKCCVPVLPVFEADTDLYETLEQAMREAPRTERADTESQFVFEQEGGAYLRQDRLADGAKRLFVWNAYGRDTVMNKGERICTEHN